MSAAAGVTPLAANAEPGAPMLRKSRVDDVVISVRHTVAHCLEMRDPMQEGHREENE
jgi:hypothetical protein